MPLSSDALLTRLRDRGIEIEVYEHPPILTVEAMMAQCGDIPGVHTKNLFLRDGKKNYFLVSLRHDMLVDLKAFRSLLGARGGLSFASPDVMWDTLGVESGAVSPLAALNALPGSVKVFLERALINAARINVHPLVNTRTLSIAPTAVVDLLADTGHSVTSFVLSEEAKGET